jgi:hypothetical protein
LEEDREEMAGKAVVLVVAGEAVERDAGERAKKGRHGDGNVSWRNGDGVGDLAFFECTVKFAGEACEDEGGECGDESGD